MLYYILFQSTIVDTFDYASEECCFPVTIDDFNPTTEEIVAGIKYVIDSGWIGRANIFARRVELKNEFGQVVQGVMLTEDETDYAYDEKNGYSKNSNRRSANHRAKGIW